MTIQVFDRQRAVPVDLPWLRRTARRALREVVKLGSFPVFQAVEVSILADADIAKVHERFLKISGPTDVITFEHGEILLGADTASRQCVRHRQKLEHELALYLIHGLLHLAGYDDCSEPDSRRMKRAQNAILQTVLAASAA